MILAIDTSCDETAAAVCDGRRIFSNVVYSQIAIHKPWGGVVPSLAKRAHAERINTVVDKALYRFCPGQSVDNQMQMIKAIAVTQGPGLAVALEVGIGKAVELAERFHKPLIAVNHLEGHMYSVFCQNKNGNPSRIQLFPYLVLIISGKHTEFVIWKNHFSYEIIGSTLDDAAGEALDKAGKLLGLGYPAGSTIERLSQQVGYTDEFKFPRPMIKGTAHLNFSFSGLKTAFYYFLKQMPEKERKTKLAHLASSFHEAVVDTLMIKLKRAVAKTDICSIIVCGGVAANQYLRKRIRRELRTKCKTILFPVTQTVAGDNAGMIGVAASEYYKRSLYSDPNSIDRVPRMQLGK